MDTSGAILVVEDDPDVRHSASVVLAPHFERVESLVDATHLEMTLGSIAYDVVLLDMNFVIGQRSGAAGLDALATVRSFDPTLAVVLMTAYGGVTLAVEALKRGAMDFILKPWRNDKLIAAVHAAALATRARRAGETLELSKLERDAIERALSRCQGNISAAADMLGLSRATLYRRIAKHGL